MPRDAAGAAARVTPPGAGGYVANDVISSSIVNSELNDIYNELTNSLDKGGRTSPTANLPMANFKLTGLGAGTVAGDSVRYEQAAKINGAGLNTDIVTMNHVSGIGNTAATHIQISAAGAVTIPGTATISGNLAVVGTITPTGKIVSKQAGKAWVNFNGVTGAVNSNLNIASVTKNGTGDFTLNIGAGILADTDYCWAGSTLHPTGIGVVGGSFTTPTKTTTALRIVIVGNTTGLLTDSTEVSVMIMGN